MASLSVNEQTDGSTPQETCILILFKTYILHRQGPGSNSIRKISTIFSYMISFIVFKKFFKKLLLSVVCSSSPNFSWKSRMLCAFCRTKKMSIAHFHVTKITMATGFKFAQIWRLASVSMPLLSNERHVEQIRLPRKWLTCVSNWNYIVYCSIKHYAKQKGPSKFEQPKNPPISFS